MSDASEMSEAHASDVRAGVRLEVFTVVWMILEAAISIVAGLVAGSLLLVAFGLDNVIELISGVILLWRLSIEARGGDVARVEQAERRAAWVVAVCLGLLCVYVLASAVYGLVTRSMSEASPVGIAIAALAMVVMPSLAVAKRLDSGALRGDAASSFTCAAMAATVLVGLVLNAVFQWWWADDVAALVFLVWLVQETREALEEARQDAGKESASGRAERARPRPSGPV